MKGHVLPDEWLMAYAAGSLNEGQALVVACHLTFHPELVAVVRDAERIGGALLSRLPDAPISDEVLNRVLGKLSVPGGDVQPASIPQRSGMFPAPLRDYVGGGSDRIRWRMLGPGLRHALLWKGAGGEKAWLLRGRGKRVIPEHDHTGDEWTLVLRGAYEACGQRFQVGDLELAEKGIAHQPVLDPSEECICLAYTGGRIRPKSLGVRMLQPFIGL